MAASFPGVATMSQGQAGRPSFEVFRGVDAPSLADCGCMTPHGDTPNMLATLARYPEMLDSGGEHVDVPYRRPGMSLARLWLKSGFPLPLHTHDCDCLYYVVAGSIVLGNQTLAAGGGFFVGRDVPYGYSAGPGGAEVIESRTTDTFEIRLRDKPEAAWEKTAAQMLGSRDRWAQEPPPVRRMPAKA